MPNLPTLALFALASLALLAIPGPVVLYTVARSIQGGRRAGFASCGGVALGDFVHVLAAAVGLSALLLSSALAFQVVKFAGAAYLIYLGIKTLLDRSGDAGLPEAAPRPLPQVFRQGIVVAALNPKTALFFLAFLPQFVDPARRGRRAGVGAGQPLRRAGAGDECRVRRHRRDARRLVARQRALLARAALCRGDDLPRPRRDRRPHRPRAPLNPGSRWF